MIAVDTNILVACMRAEYPHHDQARERIRELAEGTNSWALPWACVHEFLAVATNQRIFRVPLSPQQAVEAVAALMESPNILLIGEGPNYWETFRKLVAEGGIAGPRIHDARIAAVCITHGVTELWSADRDFGRFPTLRVRNPCVG